MQGFCTVYHTDGRQYSGHYVLSEKSGYGESINEDGTKYWGEWKDNEKHGLGITY